MGGGEGEKKESVIMKKGRGVETGGEWVMERQLDREGKGDGGEKDNGTWMVP